VRAAAPNAPSNPFPATRIRTPEKSNGREDGRRTCPAPIGSKPLAGFEGVAHGYVADEMSFGSLARGAFPSVSPASALTHGSTRGERRIDQPRVRREIPLPSRPGAARGTRNHRVVQTIYDLREFVVIIQKKLFPHPVPNLLSTQELQYNSRA